MTKNERIDGIFGVIDLWASNAVRKRPDGASVYNPYNVKELAVELYNAGYQKIDDDYFDVITKDELKEYKRQVVKEFAEKLKTKLFEFFQDNEELDGKISVGPLYVDIKALKQKTELLYH